MVLGTVTTISYEGPDPQDAKLPLTTYEIRVEQVLHGSAPNVITIGQTGGVLDGTKYEVDGDPLMHTGDHGVFYLQQAKTGPAAGRYFVLGGPQGRLIVEQDGTLSRVGSSNVNIPTDMTVDKLVSAGGSAN